MRILFAATGEIAVRTLEKLNEMGLLGAVLTSPDERGGRGNKVIESPVKKRALELGIDVYQFESLRSEARKTVSTLSCDTLLSFCYGKIFGPRFLSLFERKYNIHPSLLPKYRGPSPTYEAIRNLDRETGVSIQEIALEIDSGDIIASRSFPLDGTETLASLDEKASAAACSLAEEVFSDPGSIKARPQQGEVTFSRLLNKEDGRIDFTRSAGEIHAMIRACYPWPKAFCIYKGEKLILSSVYSSAFSLDEASSEEPGTVVALDKKKGLKVATVDYYIYISRLQAPSRKEMDAVSFVNGDKAIIGALLS